MKAASEQYYPHQRIERAWSHEWLERKTFDYVPNDKPSFTMVVPPPNITGVLHLGHALNATIQDILARQARINGYNVCWVPGSDHASIATEAKVLAKLKAEKNIDKKQLTRAEFLRHAEAWKNQYGNTIYDQFKMLGCSLDWSKQTFTLDDHYYQSVIQAFVRLYEEGLIYKGSRMIHWDVIAQTALSDEEVEHREETAELYFIKYISATDPSQFITVATKRPETIMGDVALCVHPHDARYTAWVGKHVLVPLIGRSIPVITDESIDPEFGTGVLKITPAHAPEDYRIAQLYNLPIIHTFLLDGTLAEEAIIAVGKTIDEAKKIVLDLLKEKHQLAKVETYQTRIGYSQRTNAVVEPFISTQWFVKMPPLASPALESVKEKNIRFFPEQRFENTYYNWMENIRDWCISRQLWWGHRIPAWYDKQGNIIVAKDEASAYQKYHSEHSPNVSVDTLKQQNTLTQDEDCLDTWFSSWLWPLEVFKGMTDSDNRIFRSAYPTTVLVTGHDILFFWVARMIMAGLHFANEIPFHQVYFTGMVRDKQGRKMSKSLGNSPDLIKMIEEHGADSLRFGVMISSPAGNDLLFDEESVIQGKNFTNKLWNVWKLILLMNEKVDAKTNLRPLEQFANEWMFSQIDQTKKEIAAEFEKYKLSESLKRVYSLVRNTFCNVYMEWIKVGKDETISPKQMETILSIWRTCLQMLHPYMPFITQELFISSYPSQTSATTIEQFKTDATLLHSPNANTLQQGNDYDTIIALLREAKQSHQIAKDDQWAVAIEASRRSDILSALIEKIVKPSQVIFTDELGEDMLSVPYEGWQIKIQLDPKKQNKDQQNEKIQKDLEHQLGLLASIEKKLSNARFLENAHPDVIAMEKTKLENTKTRIEALKKNI